jgi:hypothetical protein
MRFVGMHLMFSVLIVGIYLKHPAPLISQKKIRKQKIGPHPIKGQGPFASQSI